MSKSDLALGIIPARGGSKGVVRKNLHEIAGQPLISYAIETAQRSLELDDFVVSTEDDEIADVARGYGATVVKRPPDLASDSAPVGPVAAHALGWAESRASKRYQITVLLQPTSPIREGTDVDAAIRLLRDHPDADSVISVCAAEDVHPARMYREADGFLIPFWDRWEVDRRQDLPRVLFRNGAIYVSRRQIVADRGVVIGKHKLPYEMPPSRLCNIDDARDLEIAQVLVKLWKEDRI